MKTKTHKTIAKLKKNELSKTDLKKIKGGKFFFV